MFANQGNFIDFQRIWQNMPAQDRATMLSVADGRMPMMMNNWHGTIAPSQKQNVNDTGVIGRRRKKVKTGIDTSVPAVAAAATRGLGGTGDDDDDDNDKVVDENDDEDADLHQARTSQTRLSSPSMPTAAERKCIHGLALPYSGVVPTMAEDVTPAADAIVPEQNTQSQQQQSQESGDVGSDGEEEDDDDEMELETDGNQTVGHFTLVDNPRPLNVIMPQQTKTQGKTIDSTFKFGQAVQTRTITLPEYTSPMEPQETFICLFQDRFELFVRRSQLELRLNWQPILDRWVELQKGPNGNSTKQEITLVERAYHVDRGYKGKVVSEAEYTRNRRPRNTPRPLQVFNVSGTLTSMPTSWTNHLCSPKATTVSDLNKDSPFEWQAQQCLKWGTLVKAALKGKEGISKKKPMNMYGRYRPNEPLKKIKVFISFASCLEAQFDNLGVTPTEWLDKWLASHQPTTGDKYLIEAVDEYHDAGTSPTTCNIHGDVQYELWSAHPRDLFRTWMEPHHAQFLSASSEYRRFYDIKADDAFYEKVKKILGDPDTTLKGSVGQTLTCISQPKAAAAGKRKGDQATHMNGVSATTVAAAIYAPFEPDRTSWAKTAEWLHRSGFQMGGFGIEVYFHDPQSSQKRYNLVFGSRNANTVMLRYETWARKFTDSWYKNEYPDAKQAPNFAQKAHEFGLWMSDRAQHEALYNVKPLASTFPNSDLDSKLLGYWDAKYANTTDSRRKMARSDFQALSTEQKRTKLRMWGIEDTAALRLMSDEDIRRKWSWLCQSTDDTVPHCHLKTMMTGKSSEFVTDLYARWYEEVGRKENGIKKEDFVGRNFWPTEKFKDLKDSMFKNYHDNQALTRFGWIAPELRWVFEAKWTDRSNNDRPVSIKVDRTFDLFSQQLPFQIEAKLDNDVDELWYRMMSGAPEQSMEETDELV